MASALMVETFCLSSASASKILPLTRLTTELMLHRPQRATRLAVRRGFQGHRGRPRGKRPSVLAG